MAVLYLGTALLLLLLLFSVLQVKNVLKMLQGFWLRLVNRLVDLSFRQPVPNIFIVSHYFIELFSKIEKMNGNLFPEPCAHCFALSG